jgi:tetratricopeptide (TPR) repeat protein
MRPEESATLALLRAADPGWTERLASAIGMPRGSAAIHEILGAQLLDRLVNVNVRDYVTQPGDLELAIAHFDSALALDRNLAEAWRGRAHAAMLQGRHDDAIAALDRAVRLEPEFVAMRVELAQELFLVGRDAEAVPQFREVLRLSGPISVVNGSYMWANTLAWILATSARDSVRNGAEAVGWAERACTADGLNNPMTLDTWAAALAEAGRFDEAIGVSRRILDVAGDYAPTREATEARIRSYERKAPIRMP